MDENLCETIGPVLVPYRCEGLINATGCNYVEDSLSFPNFDNFVSSFITLFRICSLDGWGAALNHCQNVMGSGIIVVVLFIIIIGPCVVANICIGEETGHLAWPWCDPPS